MEFLDEESRPRFLFQSRPLPPSHSSPQSLTLHKPTLFISLSISSLIFFLSILYFRSEPFKSLFFWFAFSFLLGPFAPTSLTAGDTRFGVGPPLPSPPTPNDDANPIDSIKKPSNRKSSRPKLIEEFAFDSTTSTVNESVKLEKIEDSRKVLVEEEEEREWSEGDLEVLKKQMAKHPVGNPGRWEAITEAFQGRHRVENVIKMAKSMGEKKMNDSDSFTRFLKDRKPVDQRIDGGNEGVEVRNENGGAGGVNWSSGEDIALLNALKAFPKDVAMRWEKITAAVPGKSKAECMKRVAELKRDFRSSKASAEA